MPSSPKVYRLPCGCLFSVERDTERLVEMCTCCAKEFNVRHEASAAERAAARERINARKSA